MSANSGSESRPCAQANDSKGSNEQGQRTRAHHALLKDRVCSSRGQQVPFYVHFPAVLDGLLSSPQQILHKISCVVSSGRRVLAVNLLLGMSPSL